jgi:hypothetical protein
MRREEKRRVTKSEKTAPMDMERIMSSSSSESDVVVIPAGASKAVQQK